MATIRFTSSGPRAGNGSPGVVAQIFGRNNLVGNRKVALTPQFLAPGASRCLVLFYGHVPPSAERCSTFASRRERQTIYCPASRFYRRRGGAGLACKLGFASHDNHSRRSIAVVW